MILLKNPMNASTRLSMNGISPMISTAPPFVLRLSKDERRVFQQNLKWDANKKFDFSSYDQSFGVSVDSPGAAAIKQDLAARIGDASYFL